MKKIFVPFLIAVFLFTLIDDASAQRRGKKKRRQQENTEEKESRRDRDEDDFGVSFADKLNYEIKIGNLQFFNSQLSISLKSNVGYKLNNIFTAGLGGKLFYDYFNQFGSSRDFSVFSYGGMLFARAKISQQFYIQGEYNLVSFGPISTFAQETIAYPTAGLGYIQRGFDWSVGIELLAILNDAARDKPPGNIVEYWINISKNF